MGARGYGDLDRGERETSVRCLSKGERAGSTQAAAAVILRIRSLEPRATPPPSPSAATRPARATALEAYGSARVFAGKDDRARLPARGPGAFAFLDGTSRRLRYPFFAKSSMKDASASIHSGCAAL
jgi:hypothetical protein